MKINFACGKQTWDDYFCIDAVQHPDASRNADLLHILEFNQELLVNPIPLDDECAEEIVNYHFIEHVYAWEAPAVVAEFYRLLNTGGKLIMECPNIIKACENLLAGSRDQMAMWPLYGDETRKDPYMCHKWGYTPETIAALLRGAGFRKIKVLPPQTHGRRANRDMRIECIK